MSEIDERLLRRLAFSKDLYNNALTFCSDLNDSNSFAVGLTLLHDATENCLALIASYLGVEFKEKMYLLSYLPAIRKKNEENIDIPSDSDLGELNTLRVNIKHKGILPDVLQHKELPQKIGDFLIYMTKNFLKMDFSNISLISAIKSDKVSDRIITAKKYLNQNKYKECLIELGFAMHSIIGFPQYFLFGGWQKKVKNDVDIVFPDHYGQLDVKLLEHKVEPYLFYRFMNLTPKIGIRGDIGNLDYEWDDSYGHSKNWTELNCKFCLEFCIETALKYQRKEDPRYKIINTINAFKQVINPKGKELILWNKKTKDEIRGVLNDVERKQLYVINEGDTVYGTMFGEKDDEEVYFSPDLIVRSTGEAITTKVPFSWCVIEGSEAIVNDIDIDDYKLIIKELIEKGLLSKE